MRWLVVSAGSTSTSTRSCVASASATTSVTAPTAAVKPSPCTSAAQLIRAISEVTVTRRMRGSGTRSGTVSGVARHLGELARELAGLALVVPAQQAPHGEQQEDR